MYMCMLGVRSGSLVRVELFCHPENVVHGDKTSQLFS